MHKGGQSRSSGWSCLPIEESPLISPAEKWNLDLVGFSAVAEVSPHLIELLRAHL